jgi:D-sedoheptulose 7-phosphate isomerase
MRTDRVITTTEDYVREWGELLKSLDLNEINKVIEVLLRAYKNDNSVFIFGNGGSASTASHFACDLGKGTLGDHYNLSKKRFKVYSLTDNVATITAYANDLGFEEIFSQQLKNLIKDGDIVIAITGSGNSENVVKAVKLANSHKATTIAFLGFDGGKLASMVDHKIVIRNDNYGIIEDAHDMLHHLIYSVLKERIKGLHDND